MTNHHIIWDLPVEIWAKIFAASSRHILHGGVQNARHAYHTLQWLFSLSWVCKSFQEVVRQHPQLNTFLALVVGYEDEKLPLLLKWVSQHQAHLQLLIGDCEGPTTEFVLSALQMHPYSLRAVDLARISQPRVPLLSTFQFLTTCVLQDPQVECLDLHCLRTLTQLKVLKLLNCQVSNIDSAKYLTMLQLHCVEAECAQGCSIAESVIDMYLWNSSLQCFQALGISACSCLQSLTLDNSVVSASCPDNSFGLTNEGVCVPHSLSALTSLTDLTLTLTGNRQVATLYMTCRLRFLQSLEIYVQGSETRFRLLPSLSVCLSKLQYLLVDGGDSHHEIQVHLDWNKLADLQYVSLLGRLRVSDWLKGLTEQNNLKKLRICNTDSDVTSTPEWMTFVDWLQQHS